jgi:nucleoside-diphosphate-sugar epimerase
MFGVKPVPLPLHGDQLTTVTHAEDVASMMASVVGNEAAVGQVRLSGIASSLLHPFFHSHARCLSFSAALQVFNCATNQAITYNGLLSKVAAACGVTKEDAAPRYFDPAAFDLPKVCSPVGHALFSRKYHSNPVDLPLLRLEQGYFPFRMNHFFVSSTKAVTLLNWKPKHNVVDDLTWYADGYKAQMNKDSPPDFSKDNEINSA